MKKRKLKGFVLPTLYLLITITLFGGIIILGSDFALVNKDYNYGTSILDDNILPVLKEDDSSDDEIIKPVDDSKVELLLHFYSKEQNEELQKNSLIFYENTYLPNTGVIYASNEEFEVKTVASGKVTEIIEDEFFGKCIVVEHNNNLRTYYYGLGQIEVEVEDELTNGAVLGVSQNNTVINDKKTFLFEVYYNNKLINPEEFFGKKVSEYI